MKHKPFNQIDGSVHLKETAEYVQLAPATRYAVTISGTAAETTAITFYRAEKDFNGVEYLISSTQLTLATRFAEILTGPSGLLYFTLADSLELQHFAFNYCKIQP